MTILTRFLGWGTALLVSLGTINTVRAADKPLDVSEVWSGMSRVNEGRDVAPESGVIADGKTWEKVFQAWRPDEKLPEVNFENELVLVMTVSGPNRVLPRPMIDEKGNVKLIAISTKVGGPGFGFAMVKVNRDGLVSVQGNEIPDPPGGKKAAYVKVEVKGKLTTGIFAIGGETTGVTISANGIVWEVDFGANTKLRKLGEQLNGKTVVLKGELTKKGGVEIRTRWIVQAESLRKAE